MVGAPRHLLDDTGRLWIESPDRTVAGFDSNSPRVWWLLAPDGRLLGSIRTPIGFRPMHAGADFVLGMQGPRTLAIHRLLDARRTR
jgi:hypothetical protein